jgi:hypothetical protein
MGLTIYREQGAQHLALTGRIGLSELSTLLYQYTTYDYDPTNEALSPM